MYQNSLGRAPDAEGKTYWLNELDTGNIDKGKFLLAFINEAKAATVSSVDKAYVEAKADLGAYFSVIKGMSNAGHGKSAMALFDGTDASKTAAKNAIDTFYNTASQADSGELLIQLVGVIDDPFAG